MRKTAASIAACCVLAGCATSPWPVEPPYDRAALIAKRETLRTLSLADSRALAAGYAAALEDAASSRRQTELVANELLYYGTLVFAVGSAILTKRPDSSGALRARNIGGGTALGSSLFSSHYKLNDQQAAFRKAAARMQCANEALAPIRPEIRERLGDAELNAYDATITNPSFRDRLSSVPAQTGHFIERQVIPDLRASLQAITLAQPSRDEFATAIDAWRKDKAAGGTANGVAPFNVMGFRSRGLTIGDQNKSDAQLSDEVHAFVVAVSAYSSALTTCRSE